MIQLGLSGTVPLRFPQCCVVLVCNDNLIFYLRYCFKHHGLNRNFFRKTNGKKWLILVKHILLKQLISDVYLRPCQRSMMEFLFAKIVDNFRKKKTSSLISGRILYTPINHVQNETRSGPLLQQVKIIDHLPHEM